MLADGQKWRIIEGDCLAVLPTLPAATFDAIITDPPYPCINRSYGRWTEKEWFALMDVVVPECRRVLKPTGSAVFILQPNSERVGRMRTWLWDFLAKWGREWGVVQDVWWWNCEALPYSKNDPNGLRPSVKACVWLGASDCFRDSRLVLWAESEGNRTARLAGRCTNQMQSRVSGVTMRDERARSVAAARGGTTPFNLIIAGQDGKDGLFSHGARTPMLLARWWTRYLCPPGGMILDPFAGSGTIPLAAVREHCRAVGIERDPGYCLTARRRLGDPEAMPAPTGLFTGME